MVVGSNSEDSARLGDAVRDEKTNKQSATAEHTVVGAQTDKDDDTAENVVCGGNTADKNGTRFRGPNTSVMTLEQ